MIRVPQCRIEVNQDALTTDQYGWDNEFGHKSVDVEEFSASAMLVSNGEYL